MQLTTDPRVRITCPPSSPLQPIYAQSTLDHPIPRTHFCRKMRAARPCVTSTMTESCPNLPAPQIRNCLPSLCCKLATPRESPQPLHKTRRSQHRAYAPAHHLARHIVRRHALAATAADVEGKRKAAHAAWCRGPEEDAGNGGGQAPTCVDVAHEVVLKNGHAVVHVGPALTMREPGQTEIRRQLAPGARPEGSARGARCG